MIVAHDLPGRNLLDPAIPHDPRLWLGQDGQAIEVPFGEEFLGQADRRVEDGQAADGDGTRVLVEQDEGHCRGEYQDVEQGEQVAGNNFSVLGTSPAYSAWVSQFDGLLGYWLLPWGLAIAAALWLTRSAWVPRARPRVG